MAQRRRPRTPPSGASPSASSTVGASAPTRRHVARVDDAQRARSEAIVDRAWAAPIQRKEARKAAAPDVKESPWVRPSTVPSAEPVLVAQVFFHTKDFGLDAPEEVALAELATAYAPTARQQRHLTGRVVGHADPRPSVEPDNQTLADQRAQHAALKLQNALVRVTPLVHGDIDVPAHGEPPAALPGGPRLEDPLPHERRADLYLAGAAAAPTYDQNVVTPGPDPAKLPPTFKPNPFGWMRWESAVRTGDEHFIRQIGAQILSELVADPTHLEDVLTSGEIIGSLEVHQLAGFNPIKPPWWDGRESQIHDMPKPTRGGWSKKDWLVSRALLLLRDMAETMNYADAEYYSSHGAFASFIAELRAAHPDRTKIAEAQRKLGYLLYMRQSTKDLAMEVAALAGLDMGVEPERPTPRGPTPHPH